MASKLRKKVYVGMSGGVDSSVSAALLKNEGYDVTGVFIKVWQPDWIECNWKEERIEAMRAAAHLDIKFETLDLEKEYKLEVIDYMIREYEQGRTPNPDVMCNRYVKFGAFWKWAQEQGADFVATGHYARNLSKDGEYRLLAGVDQSKDQSYFLWTLNQSDLSHILFPVGGFLKSEVRELARKFGLPNSDKKDSQGLCFIGKVDVKEFLSKYIQAEEGKVLNISGEEIGSHNGSVFYTIGERHGFIVTKKTPEDAPYYVISKNLQENTLTVSNKELGHIKTVIEQREVMIGNINWARKSSVVGDKVEVRARYRQQLQKATLQHIESGKATLEFEETQDTLTPGQSLVIYSGEECLGGGIIC